MYSSYGSYEDVPLPQGKVFVHPSLNRVYIKIREAVVRFKGLLVNWAEKVMKHFCTQLIFGFSEGSKRT